MISIKKLHSQLIFIEILVFTVESNHNMIIVRYLCSCNNLWQNNVQLYTLLR